MGVMNMASLTPLARALPKLLRPEGRFVFTVSHPVFARNNVRFAVEQDPSWGQQRHTITKWDYLDATPDMGIGVRNQPEKRYFFDRPTGLLLNVFFENGLVMDRLEEPAFPEEVTGSRPTSWASYKLIPPVLAGRLRRG